MLVLPSITTSHDTKKYTWYLIVTQKEYLYMRNSTSTQIYDYSTSPGSIVDIVIYILPQGGAVARDIDKHILMMDR